MRIPPELRFRVIAFAPFRESEQRPRLLAAIVLIEAFVAQQRDIWRRFKICRNERCCGAFYDRSRNTSAVWHDVRFCGNAINLRASRARRRKPEPLLAGGED